MFSVSTLNYILVNDGSGKVPAYRGLVDAVRSIVRADGVKGLYQVGFVFKVHVYMYNYYIKSFSNSFWSRTLAV